MTEKGNAGVPEWAYEHAAYRSTRKSNHPSRLQIDMNYAEETHWTYRRLILEPDIDPDDPFPDDPIIKRVWHVPYSECFGYNKEAIQMASRVFKDEASRARYVQGRFAEFKPGKEVAPGYKREIHLCPSEIIPATGLECFAFCDGWHNPSVVLGQITRERRLIYIDTVRTEGADIATLLESQVGPLLRSPRWNNKWRSWRIGGDRTMANRDEGNYNHRSSDDVEAFFKQFKHGVYKPKFEGGPVTWKDIERSFNYWLIHNSPRNMPMIYISATNHLLDKGLNGAWHFKIDNSGNIIGTEPVKDEISHVMDAWANSVCVLLGKRPRLEMNTAEMARRRMLQLNRAKTYAVQGGRRVQA